MAKLKATTYSDLVALHEKKGDWTLKIGNNTTSYFDRDNGMITISLHGHNIVKLTEDSTKFSLAGWGTSTTRDRVNQFIGRNSVHQRNNIQHLNGLEIDECSWYYV